MRLCFLLSCLFLISVSGAFSQSLPQWSEADRALLENGEIVVGASLLVEDANRPPRAVVVEENEESDAKSVMDAVAALETEEDYDPIRIPNKFLRAYFDQKPDSYLVDPQRLFTNQETLDQEGFLAYCAEDSAVDMRVYLFDADQKLPKGYTLERLVEEHYADGPLTAVVFCFLGNPKRNQIMFGGEYSEMVDADELRKMLDLAKVKALEKSDPVAQMESFIVQLSISVYWIEQEMKQNGGHAAQLPKASEPEKPEISGEEHDKPDYLEIVKPYILPVVLGVFGVGGFFAVLIFWLRSRRYSFPVLDLPPRLGGDSAAGIGAVMRFHDKTESPNKQRREISDYLNHL